jgi:rubredoxin
MVTAGNPFARRQAARAGIKKPFHFRHGRVILFHKEGLQMKKYVCGECGFVYDEAAGIPEDGIAPGTQWAALPQNWICPVCGAAKSEFEQQ